MFLGKDGDGSITEVPTQKRAVKVSGVSNSPETRRCCCLLFRSATNKLDTDIVDRGRGSLSTVLLTQLLSTPTSCVVIASGGLGADDRETQGRVSLHGPHDDGWTPFTVIISLPTTPLLAHDGTFVTPAETQVSGVG